MQFLRVWDSVFFLVLSGILLKGEKYFPPPQFRRCGQFSEEFKCPPLPWVSPDNATQSLGEVQDGTNHKLKRLHASQFEELKI